MLIALLRSLTAEEWERQTVAPKWKVKDVAAHLLDTQLRKLSMGRDGYRPPSPPITDLVAFVNRLNEEGVTLYRRLSPPVLIALMEVASRECAEYHQSLDPFSPARFGVSWAGEEISLNWFDTAREFTERWHHQQQIRLAVGRPGIETPELYHPVLDCFLRALPYTYRDTPAETGTLLQFEISGDCGGAWWLYRDGDSWRMVDRALGGAHFQGHDSSRNRLAHFHQRDRPCISRCPNPRRRKRRIGSPHSDDESHRRIAILRCNPLADLLAYNYLFRSVAT